MKRSAIIAPLAERGRSLKGSVSPPPDKSITHRAMILGALSPGRSVIRRPLLSGDCLSTLGCLQALGVPVRVAAGKIVIPESRTKKTDGRLRPWRRPSRNLDCGNSGTTMRLLSGVLAGRPFRSVLSGDASLSRRPMKRVIEPLSKMGAGVRSRPGGLAPLKISGRFPLRPIRWRSRVASAQVKSAVLLAGLQARGETRFTEPALSRDHTERMLKSCGVPVRSRTERSGGHSVSVRGGGGLKPLDVTVPGDFSSAAFWIGAAAIVPGSDIVIRGVNLNPTRTGFLDAAGKMGARISILRKSGAGGEPAGDIRVRASRLKGARLGRRDIPRLLDEVPILAVMATQAEGRTVISGAEELRVKESDRLRAVTVRLKRMGARISEKKDGLVILGPSLLRGAKVDSGGDHRVAMALAVAALRARGRTAIRDFSCSDISYPGFLADLKRLTRSAR